VILSSRDLCRTPLELLRSDIFADVLRSYLESISGKGSELFEYMKSYRVIQKQSEHDGMDISEMVELLTLLSARSLDDVVAGSRKYSMLSEGKDKLHELVEELYNYWRKMERYLLLGEEYRATAIMTSDYHNWFVDTVQYFEALVRETYRRVAYNISGELPKVYRQLPSGVGAGAIVESIPWACPADEYQILKDIPFCQLVVIEPPLIYYPKRNFRRGSIKPCESNPLKHLSELEGTWYCYPAKIGLLLIFIYIQEDFMHLGTSLCNLFELAQGEEIYGKTPDGILIFGGDAPSLPSEETYYYEDEQLNLVVGYVSGIEDHDYFGYLKKTALTLHNVIMINRGMLPLHGAMAMIKMSSGQSLNIVIVGDSGAGKSETLEAFRSLAGEENVDLKVVFDDMGVLESDSQGRVIAYGTEIGAFVRLDDLQPGYAYSEVDRSIFMSPQLINARVVIPLSEFSFITAGHVVDVLLYANNYEEVDEEHPLLEFFSNIEEALPVFESGARLSKGTTDEKGLVHSYFANPFGAAQKRPDHEAIANYIFDRLLSSGCLIGMLRTRLGIKGYESKGPQDAARAILECFFA
jgi:hypothetical protein